MLSDPIPLSSLRLLLPVLVSIEGNYLRVCTGSRQPRGGAQCHFFCASMVARRTIEAHINAEPIQGCHSGANYTPLHTPSGMKGTALASFYDPKQIGIRFGGF